MADLNFAQSERPNYTAPILIAVIVLGIAAGVAYYKAAQRTVAATVTQTVVHPVKIHYKAAPQSSSFRVLKVQEGEDDLYLVPTIRIVNHLDVPLYIKDFALAFEGPEGEMRTAAVEQNDLAVVFDSFPDIKPLMKKPFFRETQVASGATAEGTLLAQFAIPVSTWDQRKSASVTIDFYHAPSMTIPIPDSKPEP